MLSDDAKATWFRHLALAAILIVTALVYAKTLKYDFVYDDIGQITNNTEIRAWSSLPHYFVSPVWPGLKRNEKGTYYRPLFVAWLLINYQFFGLDPSWWHLTSLLLHLACVALLYLLAWRLTRSEPAAAIAALIFGLHPAHIESVVWISGITDPLMCVFSLSALLAYLRARESTAGLKLLWSCATLLLYAASLLSKETGVLLPVFIFSYECLFAPPETAWLRKVRLAAARSIPYVALLLIYLGVRQTILGQFAAINHGVSTKIVLVTLPSVLLFYFKHLIWPVHLSVFYDFPLMRPKSLIFAASLIAVLVIAAALYLAARKSSRAAFAVVLMLVPLAPALDVGMLPEPVHDRYLYQPSMGLAILAALVLRMLRWPRPFVRYASVASIVIALAWGVIVQSSPWRNEETLYRYGLVTAPGNELPPEHLGIYLLQHNRDADAVPYLKRALELNPNAPDDQFNLGLCYFELNMPSHAAKYLALSKETDPFFPKPYFFLGMIEFQRQHVAEAEGLMRRAVDLLATHHAPNQYHYYLAQVLETEGKLEDAKKQYGIEAQEDPDNINAVAGYRRLEETTGGEACGQGTEPCPAAP